MIKVITPPAAEPLTLDQVKGNLRQVFSDEDDDISRMIVAARQMAEERLNRALMPQVLAFAADQFPVFAGVWDPFRLPFSNTQIPMTPGLRLPRPPLRALDSITYIDATGVQQTLDPSTYLVNDFVDPPAVSPAFGTYWPTTRAQPGAIVIQYQAGYADAASVPEPIKQWMLLAIGAWYENRTAVGIEQTFALPDEFAKWLILPYVVYQ